MRRSIVVVGCVVGLVAGGAARADDHDKAACLDAASHGQTMRDAHQLVEAREQFRICARAACPEVVQRDCASWLDAVERSLPTVVVSAKDAAGNDVVKVKLSVDGKHVMDMLDGRARPMDPGPHTFHFALEDGTTVDRQVVVKEGETDQIVSVVVKKGTPPPPPPPPSSPPAVSGAPAAAPAHEPPVGMAPLRVTGLVLGVVGVVGLGVGAVFGGVAIADKNGANCDATGFCDPAPLADARTAATASTVAFVAGGVLVATGLAFVLLAPRSHHPSVVACPSLDPRGPGLLVRGTF